MMKRPSGGVAALWHVWARRLEQVVAPRLERGRRSLTPGVQAGAPVALQARQPVYPEATCAVPADARCSLGGSRFAAYETIALVLLDEPASPLLKPMISAGYTVNVAHGLPGALEMLRSERGERAAQGERSQRGGRNEPGERSRQPALVIVAGRPAGAAWQALRGATAAPILLLLPEPDEDALLDAFRAGVDDCQLATIGPAEAVLRIRSLLRRGHAINAD